MATNSSSKRGLKPSGTRRVRAAAELTSGELFPKESPSGEVDTRGQGDQHHGPAYRQGVPKSLVKFVVGLFLLPLAWVLTKTFLQAFTTSLHHGLLATQSFGCFAAGAMLFGILYFIIPQKALMIPYVLGHEVTHALWVWIFGGKVADHFHVSLEGGHVLTDRVNTWIILAPYFFPIYSVLVVTLYGAASLAADLSSFRWLLFLLIGVTLAFHLVFTCLLILKGQPDLHYGGSFFSLMVIYLINLLVIIGLLLVTSRSVSLQYFGRLLVVNAADFVETTRAIVEAAISWGTDLYTEVAGK
ncbi:MAG: hypothetical protein WCP60_07060 [bacterium]